MQQIDEKAQHGLPIGNICSQLFANLYLNDLDHLIKSRHRYYSRYVDDMIIVDESRSRLEETLEMIEDYILEICMLFILWNAGEKKF